MLTARLKHLGLAPGDKVLDLGCGEGRHVHGLYMLGGLDIYGVDLDEPSLKKAEEGLVFLPNADTDITTKTTFEPGDATALRFEDNTFDAVICSEVLEHLPDYDAAIREMRRVLKPTGKLCITVPHAWPERICWQLAPPPNGYPYQPGGPYPDLRRSRSQSIGRTPRLQDVQAPPRARHSLASMVAEMHVLGAAR